MSANCNLLDKFLDENNNWFNSIDSLSTAMMHDLPKPVFSFKSGPKMHRMQSMDVFKLNGPHQSNQQPLNLQSNLQSNQQPHQSPNQQPAQQQPQQLTKQSVKRALFVEKDEIDHEANLKLVQKQLDQLLTEDSEKWNFDFKNNRPLQNENSQYQWFVGESVLAKLDLNRSTAAVDASPMEQPIKSRPAISNPAISNPAIVKPAKSSAVVPDHLASPVSNATGKLSNSNSTNTPISTRSSSHKRKLNIDDYFQPAKKRNTACLAKDSKATTDNLLPVNRSVKTVKYPNELAGDSSRSLRLQTAPMKASSLPMKTSMKRKCKKSASKPVACRSPRTRQKKSKSLEKATTKRQTTLKF